MSSSASEPVTASPAFRVIQRTLESGQLAHAYLFAGDQLGDLEEAALAVAKIVHCQAPPKTSGSGTALESCGRCSSCRRIESRNHPDVQWIRPESKSRVITIDQMRALIQTINLKPAEGRIKVAILVAADRLNPQGANAFLKTLEEPPGHSLILLLTTAPAQILETILSRCIRLRFSGRDGETTKQHLAWLDTFTKLGVAGQAGLLHRYHLLSHLLARLAELRASVEERLAAESPLEKYDDLEPRLREKLEDELAAAIEAEYRRERSDLLLTLYWWLRDLWLQKESMGEDLLQFPTLAPSNRVIVGRIQQADTLANLRVIEETQELLESNVQEALVLEVALLKLRL